MNEIPEKIELISQIESLGLPAKIAFIDLNGTLIPEDTGRKPDIVALTLDHLGFRDTIVPLVKKEGIVLGLCSDSPLPQLVEFAKDWGIGDGPIAAENGNILVYNGKKAIINPLQSIAHYKVQISEFAHGAGYDQGVDVVAPEFGGLPPEYAEGQWAFGANRETSISIFGPPQLIDLLGNSLNAATNTSFDISPEHNYFAIHPGDVKKNKGALLAQLTSLGHSILMVGNSASDWVDPTSGVQCAFVSDSRITQEMKEKAAYCSACATTRGVIDILFNFKL